MCQAGVSFRVLTLSFFGGLGLSHLVIYLPPELFPPATLGLYVCMYVFCAAGTAEGRPLVGGFEDSDVDEGGGWDTGLVRFEMEGSCWLVSLSRFVSGGWEVWF